MMNLKINQVIKVGNLYGIIVINGTNKNDTIFRRKFDKDKMFVSYFAIHNRETDTYSKYKAWDEISIIKNKIVKIFDVHHAALASLSYTDAKDLDEAEENDIEGGLLWQCMYLKEGTTEITFNNITYALTDDDIINIEEILAPRMETI